MGSSEDDNLSLLCFCCWCCCCFFAYYLRSINSESTTITVDCNKTTKKNSERNSTINTKKRCMREVWIKPVWWARLLYRQNIVSIQSVCIEVFGIASNATQNPAIVNHSPLLCVCVIRICSFRRAERKLANCNRFGYLYIISYRSRPSVWFILFYATGGTSWPPPATVLYTKSLNFFFPRF